MPYSGLVAPPGSASPGLRPKPGRELVMIIVWSGLTLGAVYAIVAICYNITLIGANVMNFASPFIMALGSYIAARSLTSWGWPIVAVLPLVAVIGAIVALVEEVVAIRPLKRLKSGEHNELVTTVGFATVIEGVILLIWGSSPLSVPLLKTQSVWTLLGGRLFPVDAVLIVYMVVLFVVMHLWTHRTRMGLASLARMEDVEAARLRGINVSRMSLTSFALSGALAGVSGVLVGAVQLADVSSTFELAIIGFFALTIGGARSYAGAVAGGLLLGLAEAVGQKVLGVNAELVVVLGVFAAFLMVRPRGILGTISGRLV
jgi:branched-chain amino acid transport system permease protein